MIDHSYPCARRRALERGVRFLVALSLLVATGEARALERLAGRVGLTPHHELYDIESKGDSNAWAVGALGLAIRTRDGGRTWARSSTGTDQALLSVFFLDPNTGWIAGANGTILHTKDGGAKWLSQGRESSEQLFGVEFVDQARGFVVGSFGTFLQSEDSGDHWKKRRLGWKSYTEDPAGDLPPTKPHLYDVTFLDRAGWVVGEFGLVLATKNAGSTWEAQKTPTDLPLFSVFFENERRGWAVGQNGTVLHTGNGGTTWQKSVVPTDANLLDVTVDGDLGLIVGDRGQLLHTTDGGTTWSRLATNPIQASAWLSAVTPLRQTRYLITGDKGNLLKLDR